VKLSVKEKILNAVQAVFIFHGPAIRAAQINKAR
jgi:hypothetical protein